MSKQILFYRTSQWGNVREFVHPTCEGDAQIIRQLTGQKTIDSRIRELIRDLTGSQIVFLETTAPQAA